MTPAAVAAVILAAGEGQRLRPLTSLVPKALCPVGNVALLDRALARLAGLGLGGPSTVAVNAAYLADQVVAHVGERARLSVEPDGPVGTSGGVARLRGWIDGRGVLVGNADAYLADPLREPGKDIAAMLDGWGGDTVRMLTKPVLPGDTGGFGGRRFAGFSLLPWRYVRDLSPEFSDLVRTVWRPAEAAGQLELIAYEGAYLDTGTPATYLAANLHAAGVDVDLGDGSTRTPRRGDGLVSQGATVTGSADDSVVGAGAVVAGRVRRCVIWPGARVAADEDLFEIVRAGDHTVPAMAH
ncbi:sugar phosphate nucleotidyltransferase [Actinoplanes sp. NPDC051346]|uniref:sugar phosphate nucleotidyltransferase n=1 Tax=Actinoplanes sp. NPDC051346 TaxID=3155048 RepID=UPI0034302C0B